MLETSIPKITSEEVGDTVGTFVVEPLDRGFGYTFGNSLRRVLLSKLEMTLTIARGRGYVPAEGNKGPETTIGVIPVDSIFSPVRRVSYDVDPARVGQRTDFDKLRLEVTTDGSKSPKDAVKDAAELLIRYLSIFTDIDTAELRGFGADGQGPEAAPSNAHGMEN